MAAITLAYRADKFRFSVEERAETYLRGRFQWTSDERSQLIALEEQDDELGKQPWYLDDEGYRLPDEELFQMSPWSIFDGDNSTKAVLRFLDFDTGEALFGLRPWFRIGDELNRRPE